MIILNLYKEGNVSETEFTRVSSEPSIEKWTVVQWHIRCVYSRKPFERYTR